MQFMKFTKLFTKLITKFKKRAINEFKKALLDVRFRIKIQSLQVKKLNLAKSLKMKTN